MRVRDRRRARIRIQSSRRTSSGNRAGRGGSGNRARGGRGGFASRIPIGDGRRPGRAVRGGCCARIGSRVLGRGFAGSGGRIAGGNSGLITDGTSRVARRRSSVAARLGRLGPGQTDRTVPWRWLRQRGQQRIEIQLPGPPQATPQDLSQSRIIIGQSGILSQSDIISQSGIVGSSEEIRRSTLGRSDRCGVRCRSTRDSILGGSGCRGGVLNRSGSRGGVLGRDGDRDWDRFLRS